MRGLHSGSKDYLGLSGARSGLWGLRLGIPFWSKSLQVKRYQYQLEIHLTYPIPQLYKETKTIILLILSASALGYYSKPPTPKPQEGGYH